MLNRINQQDKIRTTANLCKLIRLPLQSASAVIFLIFMEPVLPIPLLILIIIDASYFFFYAFCSFTRQHHLIHSPILTIPDLFLSTAFLLFVNAFLFMPFIFLLTAEAVLEKQPKALLVTLIILTAAEAAAGSIILGQYILIAFCLPAAAVQAGIAVILHVQNTTNKTKYEYMKRLVDNKNKLLSTLTHELRTPLAVIKTSNELILEGRPGPINETQRSLIHSSVENTKRLNDLVENILSQVKVEFAWFSMKQQPLDIRNIIRKTALDIKPYLDTRGQKLKYSYPSLMSKTIGDKRWLEQVLLNLIHNGSKNSLENSIITIAVQENEQCIVVSVHDRGSGIGSAEISHVFNEFYQSTDPTKNLNEGAGLGLTIVKDIIERHKGEVYISSTPNAGTTVSFTLPLYKGVFSGTNNTDN